MDKRWWYFWLVLLLAACGPVQIGIEPGTATAQAATAVATSTVRAEATPTSSATTTPRPTLAVSTVTPSPTPLATATLTETAVPPTTASTATRVPATHVPATRVPATATPSATSTTPAPQGPPEVISFTTDRAEADPGEGVTLAWSTANALGARLQAGVPDANGSLTWSTLAADLPANGSFVVTVENIAPAQLFRLEAIGSGEGPWPSLQLSIARRTCPETYFFVLPSGRHNCAASASQSAPMAEQVFEHGRLVWLETNNWVNPRSQPIIFVMNNSGGWVSRTDTWMEGEPESDPALVPPEGLHQPVRGLGKLWREEFREMLGWAVAPEQHYTGAFQEGWAPQPGFETGSPGWYARDIYVRLSNNDVVHFVWSSRFNGQAWELLPQ